MERPMFLNLVITQYVVVIMCCLIISNTFMITSHAIESPQYTVIYSESDFEVRLYKESSWMTALVRGSTSFEKSTKDGFHRLYQYIHGANQDSARVAMSSPVLTSANISSSSSRPEFYYVRLYLSSKYEKSPPQPSAELSLQLDKWRSRCMAVRKFSGFAEDNNVDREVETLRNSLNKPVNIGGNIGQIQVDKSSYAIAQYNSSSHLSGRVNEVWLNIVPVGLGVAEGCFA